MVTHGPSGPGQNPAYRSTRRHELVSRRWVTTSISPSIGQRLKAHQLVATGKQRTGNGEARISDALEWKLLGEVAVHINGEPVRLPGRRPRELMAGLLLQANINVTTDRLADMLWQEDLPRTARNSLQRFIADLRKALGPHASRLQTVAGGYRLDVADGELDLAAAEHDINAGRAAMRAESFVEAAERFDAALRRWSGQPLGGIVELEFADAAKVRLEELRLTATEDSFEVALALGRDSEAVSDLAAFVSDHPYRERAWRLRITALYRSGQQREALHAYQEYSTKIRDEFGLEPSPELQDLEAAILAHSPELRPSTTPPELDARPAKPTAMGRGIRLRLPLPGAVTDAAATTPVGRDRELGELEVQWRYLRDGPVSTVLLRGEAGIGKSCLAAATAVDAHAAGISVLHGRNDEFNARPLGSWVDVFDHLARNVSPDWMTETMREFGNDEAMARLLNRPIAGGPPPVPRANPTSQQALLQSASFLLERFVDQRPTLLIHDDLHFAEESAVSLLDHVLRTVRGPLMVMCTYRPSDLADDHPFAALIGRTAVAANATWMELRGLDDVAMSRLVTQVSGSALVDQLEECTSLVRQESEGNPFFATQIIRSLAESYERSGSIDVTEIPSSIRRVISARVAPHGEEFTKVLRSASVFGTAFGLHSLAMVLRSDEESVLDHLESALAANLIVEAEQTDHFGFAHGLVQRALYDGLSRARRQRLHGRCADVLIQSDVSGTDDRAPEIARHLILEDAPDQRERTVVFCRRAGQVAGDRHAAAEAAGWFQQGLDLLDDVGSPAPALHAEMLVGLGLQHRALGEPDYRKLFYQAAEIARESHLDALLVQTAIASHYGSHSVSFGIDQEQLTLLEDALAIAPPHSADQALLLAMTASESTFCQPLAYRQQRCDAALSTARSLGDPQLICRVLNLRHNTLQVPAMLDDRLATTAEAVRLADTVDRRTAWWAYETRLRALNEAGRVDEAEAALQEVARLSKVLGDAECDWFVQWHTASFALMRGDAEAAEIAARSAAEIGRAVGEVDTWATFAALMTGVQIQRGNLDALRGPLEEACRQDPSSAESAQFRALLAWIWSDLHEPDKAIAAIETDLRSDFATFPEDMSQATSLMGAAEAVVEARHHDAARSMYDRMVPWQGQFANPGPVCFGSIDRSLGRLAELVAVDAAEHHYEAATRALEQARLPFWLARTHRDRYRFAVAQGRQTDALAHQHAVRQLLKTVENDWLATEVSES